MHTLANVARVLGVATSLMLLTALLFFAVYVIALPDIYR